MSTEIIIVGSGGHAISVTNVAISCGYSVIAYVDDIKCGNLLLDIPIISFEMCKKKYSEKKFFIAIGDNSKRKIVHEKFKYILPNASFPSLIHSSSTIGISSIIGDGSIVMPLSNIGPNSAVGKFCIINTNASIDHDCNMKDYSSLAPGVVTGGNVEIGFFSAISIGSTVKHSVHISDEVVIGAGSYVNKDIEGNVVAYGTPCKIVRSRKHGDSYLV